MLSETRRVTFLVSNDIHAQHVGFDTAAGKDLGGVARRSSYIKSFPNSKGVILLDVGDAFLGSEYFTFFHGEVEMKLFETLGYEVCNALVYVLSIYYLIFILFLCWFMLLLWI